MKYKVLLLENIDISIRNIFDKETYEVEMINKAIKEEELINVF